MTIVLYNTIENNTKYIEQKMLKNISKRIIICSACMQFSCVGRTTASHNGGGGDASLQSDGV